jgi:cytochrome c-type biogenesis protein CcmH/NrfG
MADDAQRELQQRSLRNVRALLDKLENEAAAERRTRKWLAVGLVASAAVLFGAVYLVAKPKGESRTIIVQPAGRAGAPEAPPAPAPAPK